MDMNQKTAFGGSPQMFAGAAGVPNFLQQTAGEATAEANTDAFATPTLIDTPVIPATLSANAVREPAAAARTLSFPAGAVPATASTPQASKNAPACTFPPGLSFEGTASFPCDFAVQGAIKGKVELTGKSRLVIAAGGKVDGEIVAKNISIDGEAHGKIDASGGLVSFGESARCTGSIQYARMSMAEGAEVEATMKKVA